ncbi:AMP-binding protein [Spongiactinospora sp. TRM90649]|uniref:AMP-binding protein n=1 Tax=Spongiactinospora sp. TRM90649 TaxID=3031114 RepID=UPI0023F657A6|nr:AMP-binding protein [Spongiactinospora sp. TRM90649]MDF5751408.1 AMP-binding protein [Spongiactinospora sp. TRM90649]
MIHRPWVPHPGARVVDAGSGRELGGAELWERVEAEAARLGGLPEGLLLSPSPSRVAAVVRYLGALASCRPVALLDPAIRPETLLTLVERYSPAVVADPPSGMPVPAGYTPGAQWIRDDAPPVHPDLAVLLTTSGSTGSPKLVRLSRDAVLANAGSVARALRLTPDDLWPTTLPLHYTYGLTTLNAHLAAGAGVMLTGDGLLDRRFWETADAFGATSIAAVPYQFEMLRRLRFDPAAHPAIRMITQSGARLRADLVADFAARMARSGGHLVKMYGMTEAPRVAVLPPEHLAARPDSVGLAVPGGSLSIDDGEVVYRGPNVMMGYAESAADLLRDDELGGVLRTGDLGRLDPEGFLFLSGRLRRIGKVFGLRVGLDDLEELLRGHGPVAAVAGDDRVVVFAEAVEPRMREELARRLAALTGAHWSGFDVRGVERLPLLPSGKVDYRTLEAGL